MSYDPMSGDTDALIVELRDPYVHKPLSEADWRAAVTERDDEIVRLRARIEQLERDRDWAWRMIRAAWPGMPPAHTPRGLMDLMQDDESLPEQFPARPEEPTNEALS